jgi:outer membrane protein insertion porin family
MDDPFLDLYPEVSETQTGRIMFGVGINSDAGLVGNIVIDEQNFDISRLPSSWEDVRSGRAFRGDGQRFRLEAAPGTEVQRYVISFGEPYLFDSQVGYSISASYYERRFRDWDEERVALRQSLSYQLRPDLTLTGAIRAEEITISDPRVPTPPELAEVVGDNELYGFKAQLTHDTRDSPFLPTEGHIIELAFEQVIGTFDYPRETIEARQYFLMRQRPDGSGRHVLSMGGQVGFSGSDTPLYDHFFAGGYSTLRGFDFRGASPKSGDVIVGGEFQLLGTVEYMFPITADDMLKGVAFVDFGTVEEKIRIEGDDFRVAPGVGLRITVPALGPAPIALDLAFPIADEEGDDRQVFSFFVGALR